MALLLLLLVLALVAGAVLVGARLLQPTPVDLGIFEPVSGWVVYGNDDGIWGNNPDGPDVKLAAGAGTPLGWSRDGTRLLVLRDGLVILHADGSETRLTTDSLRNGAASLSADGSRVVFLGEGGRLFAVDADGGPAEMLLELEGLEGVSFAPDGTRIAYVIGSGDNGHRVTVIDADGTNPREILANDVTLGAGHDHGLAWSPAGDRIALGIEGIIYTFAPDGAGFTPALRSGRLQPFWSPDGSHLETRGPWHPGKLHVAPSPSVEPTAAPSLESRITGRLGHLAYATEDGLYVADWDGRNPRRILSPGQLPAFLPDNVPAGCREFFGRPTWSPDGRRLAIRTVWSDQCEGFIIITDAEGASMTTVPGAGWRIAWSPDSRRIVTWIAFLDSIAVYGIDGERQALLDAPASSGDHDPGWTPDGSAVLLLGTIVPLDGSAQYVDRRLYPRPRAEMSPDGKWVAYAAGSSIGVAATDGSSERSLGLVAPSDVTDFLWAPTGDRIAFSHGGPGVGFVDVATGATTLLDAPLGEFGLIRFSPEGDRFLLATYASVAPDGHSALWLVQPDGAGPRKLVDGTHDGDWQWLSAGS
jgi:Tol biopolymer transport system component